MIDLQCPQCGKQLAIPEQYAGQRGRCNGCGGDIVVPVLQAGPPPLNAVDPPVDAAPPVAYAGFWRRAVAYLIDMAVLSVPNLLGAFLIVLPITNYLNGIIAQRILPEYQLLVSSSAQGGISFALFFLIAWPYFAVMESSRLQASLGKMAVGISVATTSGSRISVLRAIWRYFMKLFSGLLLSIGYFMAAFTSKKQALHDKASKTLVIISVPKPALWARLTVVGVSVVLLIVSSVAGVLAANAIDSTATPLGLRTAALPDNTPKVQNPQRSGAQGQTTAGQRRQAASTEAFRQQQSAPTEDAPPAAQGPAPVSGTPMPITKENLTVLAHILEREAKKMQDEVDEYFVNNPTSVSEQQRMALLSQAGGNFFQRGFVDPIKEANYDPAATLQKFAEVAYVQLSGTGVATELAEGAMGLVVMILPYKDILYSQGLISAENLDALNQVQNLVPALGAQQGPSAQGSSVDEIRRQRERAKRQGL